MSTAKLHKRVEWVPPILFGKAMAVTLSRQSRIAVALLSVAKHCKARNTASNSR